MTKIRGIFATSLNILFSGTTGYEITFPSPEIMKRLNVAPSFKPADISITDRNDLLGVVVEGTIADITAPGFPLSLASIPGCAVMQSVPNKYAIYKGTVVGHNDKYGYDNVLLNDETGIVGLLPDSNFRTETTIIVQVEEPGSKSGKKKPSLTRSISCPGSYAVLIPENKIVYSKRITDPGLKAELEEMAADHPARVKGRFGIIFRSSCNDAHMNAIRADLDALVTRMTNIREKITGARKGLVIDPLETSQLTLIFSKLTLDYLDKIRQQKTPTMPGHHYWRVVTERLGNAEYMIDFVEHALAKSDGEGKKLATSFTNFAHESFPFPRKDDFLNIMHYKPNGDIFKLKPGRVIEAFYSTGNVFSTSDQCISIVLKREFNPQPWHKSFYDGLEGLDIMPGDYSTCYAKENFPVVTNKYFRADGTFLGCYYNISTPVQVFPGEIQYLDLEIDVVENIDGVKKIIDKEKLDQAVEEGHISKEMEKNAYSIVDMVMAGTIKDNLACDDTFVNRDE
jgi:protein associated with RNAse G/E